MRAAVTTARCAALNTTDTQVRTTAHTWLRVVRRVCQKKRAYSRAVVATYGQVRTAADTRVVVLQSGVYDGTHVCATAATVGQVYSYVRTAIAMDGRVRLTADE